MVEPCQKESTEETMSHNDGIVTTETCSMYSTLEGEGREGGGEGEGGRGGGEREGEGGGGERE